MSKYIVIENPGVAPVEAFTLLGASNKSGTDAIGQFGSGTKFGTLTLLRKNLPPIIYSGTLRIEFGTTRITFDGANQDQVYVNLSGKDREGKSVKRKENLSIVLRYGEIDWKDTATLALREFVSNALDAVGGDATQVRVEVIEGEPRAKAGVTRVFVPCDTDGECEKFVAELHMWFLHFTNRVWKNTAIFEKIVPEEARIYRRGVFVRTVKGTSLFDYNLNDLTLDEARVANDWTVKSEASKAFRKICTPKLIATLLLAGDEWETTFDLQGTYDFISEAEQAKRAKLWEEAQNIAFTGDCVLAAPHSDTSLEEAKGYKVRKVSSEVYAAAVQHGLRTRAKILSCDEREGRKVDAVTDGWASRAVELVWQKLVDIDCHRGEKLPEIRTYSQDIEGTGKTLGYYRGNTVFINKCLLSEDVISPELYATILEELGHHVTKCTDNSRGFQEYFIQTTSLLLRNWHR